MAATVEATRIPSRLPIPDRALLPWLVVVLVSVPLFYFHDDVAWLRNNQSLFGQPVTDAIRAAVAWFTETFGGLFAAISWLLGWPLSGLQATLEWLPWSATLLAFALLGYLIGGWRLAAFTACALMYMVVTGYWERSMNTLALVGVAAPLAAGLGFFLGVLGHRSPHFRRFLEPCLDLMQTVPAFAYLVPLLVLFGFGPVVGVIASAIYSSPAMVRNVMLGLCKVPRPLVDSGIMSGATRCQSFWFVEVPTALPQILVGLNQTIMATLSMVIIAAVIGGFNDIGWEVLSTMRKAQFGQSLLAGLVIALIAMVLDRISSGLVKQSRSSQPKGEKRAFVRLRIGAMAILALIFLVLLESAVPFLRQWPHEWRIYPAAEINSALNYVVTNYGALFEGLKRSVNLYFLLPVKIGIVSLMDSMGTAASPEFKAAYWIGVGTAALLAHHLLTWRGAVLTLIVATIVFFGLLNIPWAVTFMAIGLVAYQAGGIAVAAFALTGMSFILLTGLWMPAMLSLYLCSAAVALAFIVGGGLGLLAAENDRFSAIIRPINDTLQTMPQFVYLIPVIFLFEVGDFSALIAIIAYCIVPMIRYTEHAVRSVPPDIIEASTSMGCNARQRRFGVQLPLAWPTIMLGVNQTIMYALSMLVIAALVGTRDLGQSIYGALTRADTGAAITAGLSIAIIAMVADRIIQSWVQTRKMHLSGTPEQAV